MLRVEPQILTPCDGCGRDTACFPITAGDKEMFVCDVCTHKILQGLRSNAYVTPKFYKNEPTLDADETMEGEDGE